MTVVADSPVCLCGVCGSWVLGRTVRTAVVDGCDNCHYTPELYARRDHKVFIWGDWEPGREAASWYEMFGNYKPGAFYIGYGKPPRHWPVLRDKDYVPHAPDGRPV